MGIPPLDFQFTPQLAIIDWLVIGVYLVISIGIMEDIFMAWLLFSAINAGIGIVYLVRWYWWRINAWSEMSAITSIILIVALLVISEKATLPAFLNFTTGETLFQLGLLTIVIVPLLGPGYRIIKQPGWLKANAGLLLIGGLPVLSIYLIFNFPLPENEKWESGS